MTRRLIAVATALLLAPPAFAQQPRLSSHCTSSNICYQLNIPEQTVNSGNGDIFFQIQGPAAYSWIGLGQGSQMAGANIFVMYADGAGNVTVSPRLGTGHVQPQHDTATKITLLEGSGVQDGKMTANVRCSNCQSWSGGSMDFSASSADWIYAAKSGSAMDTSAADATISQHSEKGSFTWDFTSAQGGRDVNPFVNSQGKTVTAAPAPSQSSQAGEVKQPGTASVELIIVHGSLASMAFLALFPIGSFLLRIPGLKNAIWIHAAMQTLAYVCFIVAAGLGIYAAKVQWELKKAHPIIGLLLLALLFFQPWWGLFHHRGYKKHQMRTTVSHLHLWKGRILIILGMINGGLGLQLTDLLSIHKGYVIAYIIVAAVMGSLFIANIIYSEVKRKRSPPSRTGEPAVRTSTNSESGKESDKGVADSA